MSTTLSFTQHKSDPVPIPSNDNEEQAYKDMIKQLAAQAPEPYGAIPPLMKRHKDKSKKKKKKRKVPIRRMPHVENWLLLDSKESIPDDQDLVRFLNVFVKPCSELIRVFVGSFFTFSQLSVNGLFSVTFAYATTFIKRDGGYRTRSARSSSISSVSSTRNQ
jgi:hypothetical protein